MLWQAAVGIEDGSMAEARSNLEAIRKELERALAEGASPERIAELMDKMREAMDRYMQSLMNETDKRLRQGQQQDQRQLPGRVVTPEDLKKMLDTIQKLSESGANDAAQPDAVAARRYPAQSQARPAPQAPSRATAARQDARRAVGPDAQAAEADGRHPAHAQPDGDPDLKDGEQNNPGMQMSPDRLAGHQKGLEGRLDELLRQLGENGIDPPPSLGEAGAT